MGDQDLVGTLSKELVDFGSGWLIEQAGLPKPLAKLAGALLADLLFD